MRNLLLSLAGGLLLGLPWSIPALFPVIFVAWVPLLLLESETRDHPNAYLLFNYAFLGFVVWNILGTWWISRAQWWGAILIMVANALVQGLVFWSASRVRSALSIPFIIPFVILWMGYEHFHELWDLAWPWLNVGNALNTAPKLIQWVEFTGVRGGTLWILLVNCTIFHLIATAQKRRRRHTAFMGGLTALLVGMPVLLSFHLFNTIEVPEDTVTVALIQPNLDPYTEKFMPKKQSEHLKDFLTTADILCDNETDYLIGPETFMVRQMDESLPGASPDYRRLLEFLAQYPDLNCVIGIHSYQRAHDPVPPGSRFDPEGRFFYEAFNTALFISPGRPPQFYHKTKLVPLFERMPFVQYVGFLGDYALEIGGYTGTYSPRQEDRAFISHNRVGILPIVCFESAFGAYCARRLPEEKGFICMITNDGWWKKTPGYRYHYDFSPVRAIECRRDLVRVANTGISALIDARGVMRARTPWWEKATLKGQVHLHDGRTFFARHGDLLGGIALVVGILLILCGEIIHRVRKRRG